MNENYNLLLLLVLTMLLLSNINIIWRFRHDSEFFFSIEIVEKILSITNQLLEIDGKWSILTLKKNKMMDYIAKIPVTGVYLSS